MQREVIIIYRLINYIRKTPDNEWDRLMGREITAQVLKKKSFVLNNYEKVGWCNKRVSRYVPLPSSFLFCREKNRRGLETKGPRPLSGCVHLSGWHISNGEFRFPLRSQPSTPTTPRVVTCRTPFWTRIPFPSLPFPFPYHSNSTCPVVFAQEIWARTALWRCPRKVVSSNHSPGYTISQYHCYLPPSLGTGHPHDPPLHILFRIAEIFNLFAWFFFFKILQIGLPARSPPSLLLNQVSSSSLTPPLPSSCFEFRQPRISSNRCNV